MLTIGVAALALLRAQCAPGSLFEECSAFVECIARPSECIRLDIQEAPCMAPMDGGGGSPWSQANCSHAIVGTIPDSIGTLTAMQQLSIGENGISGTIPPTIGLCTELVTIRIASAPPKDNVLGPLGLLSGTIPSEMNHLTKLTTIRMYNTRVSGTLPVLDKLTLLNNLNIWKMSCINPCRTMRS